MYHCQEQSLSGEHVYLYNNNNLIRKVCTSNAVKIKDKAVPVKKKALLDEDVYNFTHTRRGIAVIITNDDFDDETLLFRRGSEHDTVKLDECFQYLGFDTRLAINLTRFETEQTLKIIAQEMNRDRDFDCFVLAISSHGEHQTNTVGDKTIVTDIIHCTDGYITTKNILEIFSDENCPGLLGKPRFCFIQACRGKKLDSGVLVNSNNTHINYDKFGYYNEPLTNHIVTTPFPCMTDFIVMYATPPGYYAFRRIKEGSWFVLALAKVLRSAHSDRCDINKLLRQVIKEVSYGYQSESKQPGTNMKKQSPVIYSMLTRTVYMCPK